MGAVGCCNAGPAPCVDACCAGAAPESGCYRQDPLQRYKNSRVKGFGGDLVANQGRVVCVVAAFDYEGYPALEGAGCGPMLAVDAARRFASLAEAAGAQVVEFYDREVRGSRGFPQKRRVLEEVARHAGLLGPKDTLVFYYAGRGTPAGLPGEGGVERGERLCFVEPDGRPNFLKAEEVSALLLGSVGPETRVLFITDCRHGGGVCELDRAELDGRPICHISAVEDHQHIAPLDARVDGDGGAFTGRLLESLESLLWDEEADFSIVQVFNLCYERHERYERYGCQEDSADLRFERTCLFDPDTFAWPLMPARGWTAHSASPESYLDPEGHGCQALHRSAHLEPLVEEMKLPLACHSHGHYRPAYGGA